MLSSKLNWSSLRFPVRLRLIRIKTPSIPAARNAITDAASGRYICVADDDDIALPNRLADHLACFENDAGIHGSHGGWIDFDELTGVTEVNQGKERTLETLLFGTGKITAHPTCFYRSDVLQRIRYDENLTLGSDLDLALRMASLGLRIAHTHSFVTLRRFHATNVTVTGLSNQITTGAMSRRRIESALGPAQCEALKARAKANDQMVHCRNRIDAQRLIEMLPAYAGIWRLHFPITALSGGSPPPTDHAFIADPDAPAESDAVSGEPIVVSANAIPATDPPDMRAVERVLDIVDGEVATMGVGINLAFAFVSRPIRGAAKAVRLRQKLSEIAIEAEIVSDEDFAAKRRRAFNWSKLEAPEGTRRLLSTPISDPAEVMETLASLPESSVLRGMMSIISDGGPDGLRYHIVTGPLRGRETTTPVARMLRRYSATPFAIVANSGVVCDF